MGEVLLIGGGILAVVAVLGGAARALFRIDRLENRPAITVPHPYNDADLQSQVALLWVASRAQLDQIQDQTLAIAEGIERVARAENRVTEAVRRAKRRADAAGYVDPGIEAEVAELQRLDDDGGATGSVPVLHQDLAGDDGNPSSVRGVTVEQLQRARGW